MCCGQDGARLTVVAHAKERVLASGSMDATVRVWSVATGESVASLQGHSGWVYSVAWSGTDLSLIHI